MGAFLLFAFCAFPAAFGAGSTLDFFCIEPPPRGGKGGPRDARGVQEKRPKAMSLRLAPANRRGKANSLGSGGLAARAALSWRSDEAKTDRFRDGQSRHEDRRMWRKSPWRCRNVRVGEARCVRSRKAPVRGGGSRGSPASWHWRRPVPRELT